MRCVSCLCCVWKDTCLQRRKAGKKCEHCAEEKMKEKVESLLKFLKFVYSLRLRPLCNRTLLQMVHGVVELFPNRVHKHVGQGRRMEKNREREEKYIRFYFGTPSSSFIFFYSYPQP